jgi:hypothetical protein
VKTITLRARLVVLADKPRRISTPRDTEYLVILEKVQAGRHPSTGEICEFTSQVARWQHPSLELAREHYARLIAD